MNKAVKERKLNYTFALRPSTKVILDKISIKKDIPMGQVLEKMIIEKAKKIKILLDK